MGLHLRLIEVEPLTTNNEFLYIHLDGLIYD